MHEGITLSPYSERQRYSVPKGTVGLLVALPFTNIESLTGLMRKGKHIAFWGWISGTYITLVIMLLVREGGR